MGYGENIYFQKKVTKLGKKRLMVEIPKKLIDKINVGDTLMVSKKSFQITNKDLKRLSKILKGKLVNLIIDEGITITEGYLKDLKDDWICLSDEKGNHESLFSTNNLRIISLQPKVILKGYYLDHQKVTKKEYKKALKKRQFRIAMESSKDSYQMDNTLKQSNNKKL